MAGYWEKEEPKVARSAANVLRWYEQADKLQVSQPDWTNDKGEECHGKTVTLDLTALSEEPECVVLLTQILETFSV